MQILLTGSGNGTTCGADTLDGIVTGDQLVYGMSYDEKTGAWYFSIVNKVSIYCIYEATNIRKYKKVSLQIYFGYVGKAIKTI